MKLDDIGFYTLTDKRAENASSETNLMRCEILLTPKCNLKCPYCRGLKHRELTLPYVHYILSLWIDEGLTNVRFSGGEPTIYPYLESLIEKCKKEGVKRIAISTNGTQPLDYYKKLVDLGINDFSISLDGGCCSVTEKMIGIPDTKSEYFDLVSKNIQYLSWFNYVTVGTVFDEDNIENAYDTVRYIDSLNPSDIRIISSAQYNKALDNLKILPNCVLDRHPILKYRVNNFKNNRNVRGIRDDDTNKCYLVRDDVAVAGDYHYPCIIYLREGGKPIGMNNTNFREERQKWFENHNTHKDPICRNNCLDVCVDYNNKCHKFKEEK